jgi:hypothetical protein
VDAALGLADGTEHIVELRLSRHEERDAVIVGKGDVLGT